MCVPPRHPSAAGSVGGRQPGLSRQGLSRQGLSRRQGAKAFAGPHPTKLQGCGRRSLERDLTDHGGPSAGRRPHTADDRSPGTRATVRLYAVLALQYTGSRELICDERVPPGDPV